MKHDRAIRELLTLVVITDPRARLGALTAARMALLGGARTIQVRWKGAATRDLMELVTELRQPTREVGALLIVNDRVDVALAANADGAHLGDEDLPLEAARAIVPAGFILGRSVDTPEEAEEAERQSADYVGLGPIHPTSSKADAGSVVGELGISAVRDRIGIPIVAIGGLTPENAAAAITAGADGVATLSGVSLADDPKEATATFLHEIGAAKTLAGSRSVRDHR